MADAWDPFAIDEPEVEDKPKQSEAVQVQNGGERAPGYLSAMTKDDIDYVNDAVMHRLASEKPWTTPMNPCSDLLWHEPACTLADWRHKDVETHVGNGMAFVVFNRPNENNSMQDTLDFGIKDALFDLHKRKDDFRVAVFTGNGRMYCAGGDPKGWQAQAARLRGEVIEGDGTVGNRCVEQVQPRPEVLANLDGLQTRCHFAGAHRYGPVNLGQLSAAKNWHTWYTLPQFTICLVNGSAMGGGVGCVCCCDYVIAVKKAYFVLSEVKIGVIPATISPYVIAKIGTSNAKRFFCAAENLSAQRAKDYGIVDEVVDNMKEGHKRIQEIVKLISECGPRAVESYKQIIAGTSGVPFSKALDHYTCRMQLRAADGQEAGQGLAAETAGTKPPWAEKAIGFDEWPMVGGDL